ncbi:Phox homologous domain-containing protein [Flagelloscypha sp. PMI_526]|nr:Phox homologous domain-containing protein [Flagelloscypha sp. PMI_526]
MASDVQHPFAHSTSRLEIIRDEPGIDIEAESHLYDAICEDIRTPRQSDFGQSVPFRASSPPPASLFSKDSHSIWLGDETGQSPTFARDVNINWLDKLYDVAIKTREGTTFHVLKRYSAFDELDISLLQALPRHLHNHIPSLPPKSPLAKYRPAFLEKRRRQLEYYLNAVLLHPEIGGHRVVRSWVTHS